MRVPHFLVIGGMKCATTTLHQDLSQHPSIFCGNKEPNILTYDTPAQIREGYEWLYRTASDNVLLGDVSTTYSKYQEFPSVATQAKSILGPNLKIIYLVREPIERAISHHQHMMNFHGPGRMGPDINIAIQENSAPIHYSQYADQLQRWVDLFDASKIEVVKFESYVNDRIGVLERLFEFLEVENCTVDVNQDGANRSQNRRRGNRLVSSLLRTRAFQDYIRPLIPDSFFPALRSTFLRKAKLASIPPTEATINLIFDQVRPDASRLQELLGLAEPLWDLEDVRRQHILKYCGQQDG